MSECERIGLVLDIGLMSEDGYHITLRSEREFSLGRRKVTGQEMMGMMMMKESEIDLTGK
jgi:hypothetical protein